MAKELSVRDITQAKSYRIMRCGDPNCGPHIALYDREGSPICQMILHVGGAARLIGQLIDFCAANMGDLQ